MARPPLDPLPKDDEEVLVTAAVDGDSAALERLLTASYPRLYTLCRRICTSREQAEDATQNALVSIVRGLADFDRRARFSTWSHRIASNAAIDELRRARRTGVERPRSAAGGTRERSFDAEDPGYPTGERVAGSDPLPDPLDQTVRSETRRRLARELALVDERFRVPMVLRDVGQLDYDEISGLLDIPPGTVRSRISRGRAALRAALTGSDLDPSATHPTALSDPGPDRTGAGTPGGSGNPDPSSDVETERR